jgi:tRNA-uridine 2-sulfurtransferase
MAVKALIAMSGGVDSSVAAFLCKEKGYECTGCTMKLYNNEDASVPKEHTCCSLDDVEDARSVAYRLGMPYYVFNFSDDFKEKVIDRFVDSYIKGKTPNPCIDCNRYMKFDKLYDRASLMGCEYVVTGHYARIEKEGDKFLLKKGLDESKDQSYVLYSMTQEQLARTLFPLGSLHKTEVREIAEKNGFINANKPDSQDICFVPDGDYAKVIKEYSGYVPKEGNFVDLNGNVMGKHKGIIHYTIGQRKGLGVTFGAPKYVCKINAENNTVTLGDNSDLFNKEVHIENINWISGEIPTEEFRCNAKIRYNQKEQPAKVIPNGTKATLIFDEGQRAITPGQAAVIYIDDTVIGGGTIV